MKRLAWLLLPLALAVHASEADLERALLDLERDLDRLEEAMAAPPDARLAIYLEVDVGSLLRLQSVRLELDGRPLTARMYREAEAAALARGGMDRLHLGVIPPGEHRLAVWVVGIGPHDRPYRLAEEHRFTKGSAPLRLRVRVTDVMPRLQPRLEVNPW